MRLIRTSSNVDGNGHQPAGKLPARAPRVCAPVAVSVGAGYLDPGLRQLRCRQWAMGLVLLLCCASLAGCLQGRSAGTTLDDQNTEYRVISAIRSDPAFGGESHIKVEVHEGIVLLLGETDTAAKQAQAAQLAQEVYNVDRVVNEIIVRDQAGLASRTHNSWLTTKVNSALAFSDQLDGIDTARVKVVSSLRTVYLMGLISSEDAEAVTEVVRNVGGVEKVVKVFKYTE